MKMYLRKLILLSMGVIIGMSSIYAQEIYHSDDLAGLKSFLNQNRIDGKKNYESVGLSSIDFQRWDNTSIENIQGVVWNNENPKRIQKIEWRLDPNSLIIRILELSGELDCSKFEKLEYLDVREHKFSSLNLSKNLQLKELIFYNTSPEVFNLDISKNINLERLTAVGHLSDNFSISNNTKLKFFGFGYNDFESFDYSKNILLEGMFIEGLHKMDNVDLSKNNKLKSIAINVTSIKSLKLPAQAKPDSLNLVDNMFRFSTLPLPPFKYYAYSSQKIVGDMLNTGDIIDLSSEYSINGVNTTYKWSADEVSIDLISAGNGKFRVPAGYGGKTLVCNMTNTTFPLLTLRYEAKVKGDIIYHEKDKEGLRKIIRQVRPKIWASNIKGLGLSPSDTLNWYSSEEWVGKIVSLKWNEESPKQLAEINWDFYSTAGNLEMNEGETVDFSSFDKLRKLAFMSVELDVPHPPVNVRLNNSELKELSLYALAVDNIGFTKLPSLENLRLILCHLENNDLSKNTNLKQVSIGGTLNNVDVLDFSYCTVLEEYSSGGGGTNVKYVNLKNNKKLKRLDVVYSFSDWLTDLNFPDYPDLKYVNLQYGVNSDIIQKMDFSIHSKLDTLIISGAKAKEFILPINSNLIKFEYIGGGEFNVLDVSKQTQLKDFNIYTLNVKTLNLSSPNLEKVIALGPNLGSLSLPQNNNNFFIMELGKKFKFSTLPLPPTSQYHLYTYSPQDTIDGGILPANQKIIDLSSEYNINGKITNYKWFSKSENGKITEIVPTEILENGKFSFEGFFGQIILCEMTNETFPGLKLIYKTERPYATAEDYHPDDLNTLKSFLLLKSASDKAESQWNYQCIGLTDKDMERWDNNYIKNNITGIVWNEKTPKRIVKIDWNTDSYQGNMTEALGGSLDVRKFAELEYLRLYGHELLVDVSKNKNLEFLHLFGPKDLKKIDLTNNILLKTLILDDLNISNLDITKNVNLERLELVFLKELSKIDLSKNTKLKYLACAYNEIEDLDLSQNPELEELYIEVVKLTKTKGLSLSKNNKLKKASIVRADFDEISLSSSNDLKYLEISETGITSLPLPVKAQIDTLSIKTNKLKFSTLPLPSSSYKKYEYAPQDTIDLGVIPYNHIIDMSSEYMINGKETKYKDVIITSALLYPEYLGEGKIKYPEGLFDYYKDIKMVYELTNESFPGLKLYYTFKLSTPDTSTFHQDDVNGLKAILLQTGMNNKKNHEHLGITAQEMNDFGKVIDDMSMQLGTTTLRWNKENPRRLERIYFNEKEIGGNWDCSKFTMLKELVINETAVESINITKNQNLETLKCRLFEKIDFSGCSNLKNLTCHGYSYSGPDINLDLSKNSKLENIELQFVPIKNLKLPTTSHQILVSFGHTKLNLSDLPLSQASKLKGGLGSMDKLNAESVLDLSAEYVINGKTTEYKWMPGSGATEANDVIALGGGKFIIPAKYLNKYLVCQMTNPTFPNLTSQIEYYVEAPIPPTIEDYNINDLEGLKTFLMQNADDTNPSVMNYHRFGISDNEMKNWNIGAITKVTGIEWTLTRPMQITKISWDKKQLTGIFDGNKFEALTNVNIGSNNITDIDLSKNKNLLTLDCSKNNLTELQLAGNSLLTSVNCKDNNISVLKVPSSLNNLTCENNNLTFSTLPYVALTQYQYNNQSLIDGGSVTTEETIDLSKEYIIGGTVTNYKWLLNNKEVTMQGKGNGKFSASSDLRGRELICQMTNTSFPGLTLQYKVVVSGTSGIEKETQKTDIVLAPNIVNTGEKISITNDSGFNGNMQIYNLQGQKIQDMPINNYDSSVQIWRSGIYIARIILSDNSLRIFKILVK